MNGYLRLPTFLPSRIDGAAAAFAATAFGAAMLLFVLEPMFVKMALPRLGGSSEVWTACVLFYQLALLAGYGYAHLVGRLARVRDQALIHGALCMAAAAVLPFAIPAASQPAAGTSAVAWLLRTLVITVGAPFFVLAATSPLVQRWFALARPGADPYPLYAASNAGSLVALLVYPFVIEPLWGLRVQSTGWAMAYAVFLMGIGCCTFVARTAAVPAVAAALWQDSAPAPLRRLRWIAWAFVPSSLMLSVTTSLSERVAPIPLLWTLPLGIYLGSFAIVFATRGGRLVSFADRYAPLILLPLVFGLTFHSVLPPACEMVLQLAAFSAISLVCHGAIARDRPDAAHLTEFYFYIAAGGVAGGAFNGLLAPLLFRDLYEYPIVLVAACFALRPRSDEADGTAKVDVLFPLALGLALAILSAGAGYLPAAAQPTALKVLVGVCLVAAYASVGRPRRFGSAVGAIVLVAVLHNSLGDDLYTSRDFYGVKHVAVTEGTIHELLHGHTLHGAQNFRPGQQRVPLTYYTRSGPLGDIFAATGERPTVAVVGLGAGSTACYRRPKSAWTFFEIDPGVAQIARDPRYFRYLADCAPDSPVVIGDGRLSLAAAAPDTYDLIVLDAYASDAIPTHLLTREAMQLYRSRLRPHGLIAFHLSNVYFDFVPLVTALARDAQLIARARFDPAPHGAESLRAASNWMVVARRTGDLGPLAHDVRWRTTRAAPRVWTDDYSSVVSVLRGRGDDAH